MTDTFEMLWDCEFCGTKKLLAMSHKHCPQCGGAQDPRWRYFPSDDEKVRVANHVFVGADNVCPACRAPNAAASEHCAQCGAPLAGAKEAERRADQEGKSFQGESVADAKREHAATPATPPATPVKRPSRINWPALAFFGFLFCLFGYIALDTLWTKDHGARVVGHSWRREIQIERFGPTSDASWCDAMPSDAYHVSRKSEVRSHKQVADGKDCSTVRHDNGDGTFSESEKCTTHYREDPVYDSRCYYTVDRWHYARSLVSAGKSLADTVTWPTVDLTRTGQCMGCEREGARSQLFKVALELDKGVKKECELDQERWARLALGSTCDVEVSVVSGAVHCDSLRPQGSPPREGH